MNDMISALEKLKTRKELFKNAKKDYEAAQKSVGISIRLRRKSIKESYQSIADKVGVSKAFLNDIELGRRFPSEEVLEEIVKALKSTPKPTKESH